MREVEADLEAAAGLVKAPVQPSLLTENVVGYDAAFYTVDFAVLLQFKRADFIKAQHRRGECAANGSHEQRCGWFHLRRSHHRFDVDTSSRQWHAMHGYEVEFENGYGDGMSLYLAPLFHTQGELNDLYKASRVLDESLWVSPSEFPADGAPHRFASTKDRLGQIVMSEPREPQNRLTRSSVQERVTSSLAEVGADGSQAPSLIEFRDRLLAYLPQNLAARIAGSDSDVQQVRREVITAAALLGAGLAILGREESVTDSDPDSLR